MPCQTKDDSQFKKQIMVERMQTNPTGHKRSRRFWLLCAAGGVLGVAGASVLVGWFAVGHVNLGPFVGRRATAMLGRPVTIHSLTVKPGSWLQVQLDDVHVANIEGGTEPDMVRVGHLSAEVKLASLFKGPMIVRHVAGDSVHVLVERTPQNKPNWRFKKQGDEAQAAPTPPALPKEELTPHFPPQASPMPAFPVAQERSSYPTSLDVAITNGDVIYRTSHGTDYRAALKTVNLETKDSNSPVTFKVDGAYNTNPVQIEATLQPFADLRDSSKPYGMQATIRSGDMTIKFDGTATDPVNADGLAGHVTVDTPTSAPLMAIAGLSVPLTIPMQMEGEFVHAVDVWRLTQGKGSVKGNPLTITLAELKEGARGQPDHVKADIAFDKLDLNGFLAKNGAPSNDSATDLPLMVIATPDPLVEARVIAKDIRYNVYRLNSTTLMVSVMPGVMNINTLSVGYLGATLNASGKIEAAAKGNAHVQGQAALTGADIDAFRRALGFQSVPLRGRLDMQMTVEATQPTLNAAMSHATVAAAVSMKNGALDRKVIKAASADLGMLFHKVDGTTPVQCLLAVVSMQNNAGQALPLRIKTADGTLSANARFDINRKWFDLIFSTQSETTGRFALDIPVRVSGSFSSPTVGLAKWSAEGRAMLAQSERLTALPAGVRKFAQGNACYRAISPEKK